MQRNGDALPPIRGVSPNGFHGRSSRRRRSSYNEVQQGGAYAKSGSDESFNDQEFVADVHAARGGYIKFGEKGQAPEKHLGSIFPKDEAPLRSSLGNTDKSEWAKGRFSDEPEDPWTAVIEIPLQAQGNGRRVSVLRSKQNIAWCRDETFSRRPAACRRGLILSFALASAASSPSSGQSRSRC